MNMIPPGSHGRSFNWLELTSTNNDPNVVVKFFLDAVVKLEGSYRS